VLLWAARRPPGRVANELTSGLADSVPGARPVLAEVRLPTDAPAAVVRERAAGAHAVVVAVDYYELMGTERGPRADQRLAAARGRLAEAAGRLSSRDITIVVDGRTELRSDPASQADWTRLKAVENLGLKPGWPADVIVESAPDTDPAALATRVLRPFRENLAAAFTEATFNQVAHAIGETDRNCRAIRKPGDSGQPVAADLRWTRLQALTAGRLAMTMAEALGAGDPADNREAGLGPQ
jgi:hypothetical protein